MRLPFDLLPSFRLGHLPSPSWQAKRFVWPALSRRHFLGLERQVEFQLACVNMWSERKERILASTSCNDVVYSPILPYLELLLSGWFFWKGHTFLHLAWLLSRRLRRRRRRVLCVLLGRLQSIRGLGLGGGHLFLPRVNPEACICAHLETPLKVSHLGNAPKTFLSLARVTFSSVLSSEDGSFLPCTKMSLSFKSWSALRVCFICCWKNSRFYDVELTDKWNLSRNVWGNVDMAILSHFEHVSCYSLATLSLLLHVFSTLTRVRWRVSTYLV